MSIGRSYILVTKELSCGPNLTALALFTVDQFLDPKYNDFHSNIQNISFEAPTCDKRWRIRLRYVSGMPVQIQVDSCWIHIGYICEVNARA